MRGYVMGKISYLDKNEDGVSESLAFILLAAIVLVLSMIIAVYTFGLVQTVDEPDLVVVTVSRVDSNTIDITLFGGEGVSMLDSSDPFKVMVNGAEVTSATPLTATPGSSARYAASADSRIVIVGKFVGASEKVIYDKTF